MIKYSVSWLPDLVTYNSNTSWDEYIEALYQYFKQDFIDTKITFRGQHLRFKEYPLRGGKVSTFYHITTEGDDEENRIFDIARCERIRWPKPIIESNYAGLKIWENKRGTEENILIWFDIVEYLIVIRKRKTYNIFWTAYPVTEPYRKKKLQKEYEKAQIPKTAP